MENNVLVNEEQALGAGELLKVTALVYLKDALVNQQFETCPELIGAARKYGAVQGDISAVIKDYLNGDGPRRKKGNRLNSY